MVHHVHTIIHFLSLFDVYGRGTVKASSARKSSVPDCSAAVDGDSREQPECFGHDVLQVRAALQRLEGDGLGGFEGAKILENVLAQLLEDLRVSDQEIECPSEKSCSSIAARKSVAGKSAIYPEDNCPWGLWCYLQNVEQLASQLNRVPGRFHEFL